MIFLLAVSAYATLMFDLPSFCDNPVSDFTGVIIIGGYLAVLFVAVFWFMLAVTSFYASALAVLPVFFIVGSVITYYRLYFDATVTAVMIDAVLHTDFNEAAGVMSPALFIIVFINLGISCCFLYWRKKIGNVEFAPLWLLAGVIGGGIFYNFNGRIKNSVSQRYPYQLWYYGKEYLEMKRARNVTRERFEVERCGKMPDSLTVVLVIGEAVRWDHLSINGYQRHTTPLLEKRTNVVSLGDVRCQYSYTSDAVPYMLTPADSNHLERAYSQESIIPYYKAMGFRTVWLSNQDNNPAFTQIVCSSDSSIFVNGQKTIYVYSNWTDLDLLPPMKQLLEHDGALNLYVIHTIGAHWYYDCHYPDDFRLFVPTTGSRVVKQNEPQQICNSYDNCIVCMDYFIDSLCTMLEDRRALVIYQSDHGEALGENGKWLHATSEKEEAMLHAGGFIWYSDAFRANYKSSVDYIDSISTNIGGTEYVFPLMMKIIGLQY